MGHMTYVGHMTCDIFGAHDIYGAHDIWDIRHIWDLPGITPLQPPPRRGTSQCDCRNMTGRKSLSRVRGFLHFF